MLDNLILRLEEPGDVVGRIDELTICQRSLQPISKTVAFPDTEVRKPLINRGERRRAETQKTGSDLSIEQHTWNSSANQFKYFEVLIGGVKHGNGVTLEDLGKRSQINSQGVNQYQVTRPSDLHQSELWVIGPLPVKFRIERVAGLGAKQFYYSSKIALGVDNSKVRLSHVTTSNWRCSAHDWTSGVDPTIRASSNVDRIDPLGPKKLSRFAAASTKGANDIDRTVRRNFVNTIGHHR